MFTGTLKPYQESGTASAIAVKTILLAYDLGTGKTVLSIAAIESLREKREVVKPVLVLCLSSLKYQWEAEIKKFSDRSAIVIDGTPVQRKAQYEKAKAYDYVIMNYEQVVNDKIAMSHLTFDAVIADEATAIKGFRAKRSKRVKEIAKSIPIRLALTGTPVENGHPEEIYSIMEFVDKKVLGRFDIFDKTFIVRNQFGGVERYRNLELLHRTLAPYVIRKRQTDPDVAPYLPVATHREPILVPLDRTTQKLYDYIAEDLYDLLIDAQNLLGSNFSLAAHYGQGRRPGDPGDELRGKVMSRITALRMLCSHPSILLESYKNFQQHTGSGSAYIASLGDLDLLDNLAKTPKLDVTIKYLADHLDIDPSYKAVIFASYLQSVSQLVVRLEAHGYQALPYTGGMNAKQKHANKVEFQTNPAMRVLVSSDAGGYGVDLPESNLLVNYDQPWSSGLAVQRNGRINRTSSTWPTITIQDILIRDSLEARQFLVLGQKKAVAEAVVDGLGINAQGGVDFSVGSMLRFLTTQLI